MTGAPGSNARVQALKAVRFCVTLEAVGLYLFRATAMRLARNRAAHPGPGSPTDFSWLCSSVKEQSSALCAAVIDFLPPATYLGPAGLKMTA